MHTLVAVIAVPVLIVLSILQIRSPERAGLGLRDFVTVAIIALIVTLGHA